MSVYRLLSSKPVQFSRSGTCLSVLGLEKPRAGGCMGLLRFLLGGVSECPLGVISRHNGPFESCLLYPRKQTFVSAGGMSEKCHKRTSGFSLPATSSFEARCLGNSNKTPEQKWQRLIVS
jgi:hypothetical protein